MNVFYLAIKVVVLSGPTYNLANNYEIFAGFGSQREAVYEVAINRIFKGSDAILEMLADGQMISDTMREAARGSVYLRTSVHTSADSGTCGVKLRKGERYLLTGEVRYNQLDIQLGNWIKPWHELTPEQKRGISGDYDCDCNISKCINGFCFYPDTGCKVDLFKMDPCSKGHQSCSRKAGKCDWNDSREYRLCRASQTTFMRNILNKSKYDSSMNEVY